MKKIIIAGVIAVIIAAGAVVMLNKPQKPAENEAPVAGNNETEKPKSKTACELITIEDAKNLLGENATLSEGSGAPTLATTESVAVDNCSYSSEGATLGDLKQITIQLHTGDKAQVKQAYDNYKKEFPGEPLTDLGDEAYVTTEGKQVNVMKDGNWVFLAGGSINAGESGNKELQIKAAQIALDKL